MYVGYMHVKGSSLASKGLCKLSQPDYNLAETGLKISLCQTLYSTDPNCCPAQSVLQPNCAYETFSILLVKSTAVVDYGTLAVTVKASLVCGRRGPDCDPDLLY